MVSVTFLIVLAVLTVLIIITLALALGRKEGGDAEAPRDTPIIHMSGIYSVLRESPRGALAALRPNEDAIRKYLNGVSEDMHGATIRSAERAALLKHWKARTEANLREIETGDKNGAAFYYYDFPYLCPACEPFVRKGNFVTREEIYNHPEIIPPFHMGCSCVLTAHQGSDSMMRETVTIGMLPFFEGDAPPPLPEWTTITLLSARAEAKT
jgi:hypothetical protein